MMKVVPGLIAMVLFSSAFGAGAQDAIHTPDARMLRFPDVSKDEIVFVYAGDLWIVGKQGGTARRLSSPKGQEMFPKFSADGSLIAFNGNYDGNTDVYVVPAEGGTPRRLTHHPDTDMVVDWYPDGRNILYRSTMASPSMRFNRFFKQPVEGGLPEALPLPYAELASFSPDGTRMAFQFISCEFRTWKRYQGGMASDLWLYDFVKNTSEKITDFAGTDAVPMWHKNTIYFLSDRDEHKKLNLWACDLRTKKFRQVTGFTEYDVKWPSIGPDAIVFENGGALHLLDLATEKSRPLKIQVPCDLPQTRPVLKGVSDRVQNCALSPSGKRAIFEARGEVFTVPEKYGSVRNLTNTSGVAERYPTWSPDGKLIAYFSDRTGEYELYVRGGDGTGEEKLITRGGTEQPSRLSVGLLGCDFEPDEENNAYRISKIYKGATWDAEVRSPLCSPGVDVREGDYLRAVNGRPVETSMDPWAAFQGLAGETVRLTISHTADANDTNDVLVQPMSSEFRLGNLAWIEDNRRKVEKATRGRVGYVYVPDTGTNGQNELVRQFTPQWDKEALIIDERFNSGGQVPDRFIELLRRPVYNYWARRDLRDWQTPSVSHAGPKVMLINGWSGSGGDAFPYYFREAGLGPLVGTRTWGGLIGISGNPQLIDGGTVTAPTFGMYEDSGWAVEGYGVAPDYEVENAPHEMVAGRDPQLEKGIDVALKLLDKQPPKRPPKPAYPNRSADAN